MLAAYGGLNPGNPKLVWRKPGGPWQPVRLPGIKRARAWPVRIEVTEAGFVVVAEGDRGIMAWRSPDGQEWSEPEILPDSDMPRTRFAPTTTVYDADRDILLVLAVPDRVWRSVAGGTFEPSGPLAAPVETDDAVFAGTALEDGFLVATSDDSGMRLQTSPDGTAWTRAPDGPDYAQAQAGWILVHRDRAITVSSSGGPIMRGPSTISAYQPVPDADPASDSSVETADDK